jgi:HAD superfamily hydrolase (TIGR01509 family)
MLKAILFDMDDTLLDWSKQNVGWAEYHARHTRHVLSYVQEHITPLDVSTEAVCNVMLTLTRDAWEVARESLRAPHIGDILVATFQEFGVATDTLDPDALIDAYRWELLTGVEPFSDVAPALERLRRHEIKIGLVTNAFQPMRIRLQELSAFGLDTYFEANAMFSAADVGYLKPHPRIFEVALEALGVQPQEAVFVGDSREADILGAKNVNMRAVLRTRPDSTASLNNKITPDGQLHSLDELFDMLDNWFPGWQQG